MVKILKEINEKKATMVKVPKEKPIIIGNPGMEEIVYNNFSFPESLNRRFLQRCGVVIKERENYLSASEVEKKIYETSKEKDLYIRFAGDKPLSVVTDKFKEISPKSIVEEASKIMGEKPLVRYFTNNESLQLNFPIKTRFEGIYLTINTGNYGMYGGSGSNAVSCGIAWYNNVCSNWTIFLDQALKKGFGRVLHTKNSSLESKLTKTLSLAKELDGKIEESNDKYFQYGELDNYFARYEKKGLNKKIAKQIREENPLGMSAYDLSYRLTELCQDEKLSDASRANIEYLAGEVILCYDSIKKEILKEPKLLNRIISQISIPQNYVSLR